jgi:hypothetical protein
MYESVIIMATIPQFFTVPPSELTNALNALVNQTNASIATAASAGAVGAAGGDLTGTYPNPTIAAGAVGLSTNKVTGNLPVTNLNSGTSASATTFWRGDGTWVTPTAGSGTVTSVAQSFTGGLISVGGSPITVSGTLALTVAGTSGGIPYFSSASAWASSGALTASALVLGGGAGAAPTPLASLGTTTTVLHGNAAGAPTFGAVSLTADVTGILPVANGGTGSSSAAPYDIAVFFPGVPGSSAKVSRFVATRSIILPVNLTGSVGKAGTASTGTATIDIQVNAVSKGSVVFTASATATFTFASQVTLVSGDILLLVAPSSADATLADISITFAGTR